MNSKFKLNGSGLSLAIKNHFDYSGFTDYLPDCLYNQRVIHQGKFFVSGRNDSFFKAVFPHAI